MVLTLHCLNDAASTQHSPPRRLCKTFNTKTKNVMKSSTQRTLSSLHRNRGLIAFYAMGAMLIMLMLRSML